MKWSVKQNLCFLLCMVLLLSMLPMTVFGETVTDPGRILNDAYNLASGENLPYTATLTGVITKINSPYSPQFKNITVTIEIVGHAGKTMYCYRIKGEGADKLTVGDTITVTGTITNYNGYSIQFAAGSTIDSIVSGGPAIVAPSDPKQIVDEAYALADGETLEGTYSLTGEIISVDTPFDSTYGNVTVSIVVEGKTDKPIVCYRLAGEGADALAIGDTITVSGSLTNYMGKIEFAQGCTLDDVVKGENEAPQAPEDPKEIVDAAYALEPGASLPYTATLIGTITEIVEPYTEEYKNITVKITVVGREDKPIVCYRMKGEGVNNLKVGDKITVSGILKNFVKTNQDTGESTSSIQIPFANLLGVTTGNTGSTAGSMSVRVDVPEGWGQCYVYSWAQELFGGWPGTQLTRGADGFYRFLLTEPVAGLVISSGDGGPQTEDIKDLPFVSGTSPIITVGALGTSWKHSYSISSDAIVIPPYIESVTVDAIYVAGAAKPSVPGWLYGEEWRQNAEVNRTIATGKIYTITYPDLPAGTYEFKFAANGDWTHNWGGGHTELNTVTDAVYNGQNITFTLTETSTVTLKLDLTNLAADNTGAKYTISTGNQGTTGTRTLTIEAPASWAELYLYTWGTAEEFGTFPGAKVQKSGDQYKVTIRKSLVNLIISGKLYTGQHQQTADIALETNKDVWIQIREDATYTVSYREPMEALDFRVVGDAFWLGNWDVTSTLGSMNQVSENVYQVRFPGVVPGEYAFKIARDDSWNHVWDDNGSNYSIHATRDCAVTVTFTYTPETGEGTAQVTYTPKYKGDITGDKKLNVADVSKVYAHARRTALITDALLLAAGDFTGDGKINVADTSKMYSYLRGNDQSALLETAYQLQQDQVIPKDVNLTGTVVRIPEPYHATSGSVTVSIVLEGMENEPVLCSRLTGEDTQRIGIGSRITVKGTLQNFYGSVEFIEGCQLVELENDSGLDESQMAIVDEAYALGENQKMNRQVTLTGQVLSIRLETYGSAAFATASIAVPGRESQPITCYRMVGNAITQITTGDTITVTGTLQNFYGSIEFEAGCQLISRTSGGSSAIVETDPLKIVDMAYALQENTQMDYDVTLTGRVTKVEDAYSSEFQNITVSMVVVGRESKPIKCYRMKGTGVDQVAVNDTITVKGRIKNYNGNIMFDTGCELISRTSGGGVAIKPQTDPAAIMAAAKQLAEGEELAYDVTLSGKVLSVDEAYNSQYQNVTVTIAVSGTNNEALVCYRMKGDGVEAVAAGDTITLTGRIKNHYGTIELVYGEMTARTSGGGSAPVKPNNQQTIVDEAYALQNGGSLSYTAELTGTIVGLKSPFDAQYQHMTVIIAVAGREDKPIECYRMKGDSIGNHLCVGDTITVSGKIRNYNGSVEFDSGCKMISRTPGSASVPGDSKQIVDAAFALGENQVLPYFATLTGVVKSIDEPYTDQYKNVTLTMTVRGTNGSYDIVVYRMKGNGADSVAAGNTITVTGAIKRFVRDTDEGVHEDKVEFDSGCVLDAIP